MKLLVCIVIFVMLLNNGKAQSNKKTDTTIQGCTFMVKSCKTQCETYPNDYVFWSVDFSGKDVTCQRITPGESSTSRSNSEAENSFQTTTFKVQCCEKKPCTTSPSPQTNIDEKKLDTLFVLGVATLTSILLICLFVFLGLVLYKRKNRSYKLDGSKGENHSITKESVKTSTTLSFTDCIHENSPPTTSSSTPPPKYMTVKEAVGTDSKLNNDYVNRNSLQGNNVDNQDYVSAEGLLSTAPRSIVIRKDAFDAVGVENSSVGAKVPNGRVQIADDYEIRGGFIQPKRTSDKSETKSTRFAESEEKSEDLLSEISLHLESNQSFNQPQSPGYPSKINHTENVEDPYVQAPPLKSQRSHPKLEPDAYQTLMPSNGQAMEANEYNILLHNSPVTNNETKLMFLNNNTHSQASSKNVKATATDA